MSQGNAPNESYNTLQPAIKIRLQKLASEVQENIQGTNSKPRIDRQAREERGTLSIDDIKTQEGEIGFMLTSWGHSTSIVFGDKQGKPYVKIDGSDCSSFIDVITASIENKDATIKTLIGYANVINKKKGQGDEFVVPVKYSQFLQDYSKLKNL